MVSVIDLLVIRYCLGFRIWDLEFALQGLWGRVWYPPLRLTTAKSLRRFPADRFDQYLTNLASDGILLSRFRLALVTRGSMASQSGKLTVVWVLARKLWGM
jgi:hypothetical protein